jgi:MoaA/NifB/PqqE/SkfB family radical SAM enzyme
MLIENIFIKISKEIIRQLDRLGYLKQRQRPRVSYHQPGFVVSFTTRCNFNCPHCLRATIDKNKTSLKDLPPSVFKTVLEEGKKLRFRYISISGGEPILHPDFKEMISLINSYGYRFYLTSNGWFYKEYWEFIRQSRKNFKSIFLSLDGLTPEIHDAVRDRQGSFEKIIEAIEFYRERRVPMMVTFCVTPKNYHQIEELPDFCLKRGVNSIKWVTVIPTEREPGAGVPDYLLNEDQRREALQKIFRLQEEFRGRCFFIITASFLSASGTDDNKLLSRRGIDFCSALNGCIFFVDHDGAMMFCCDINREIKNKPFIQDLGFEGALKAALDAATGVKKKFVSDLFKNPGKIIRLCDFCNENVGSCSRPAAGKDD